MSPAPQNLTPTDPTLKDLLDALKKDILLTLCSHHIAVVNTFDPVLQRATASVVYKKTFYNKNAANAYVPVQVPYSQLLDCPVVFLGGGDGALTFNLAPGDECLAIFNDRDIDNWQTGDKSGVLNSNRLHAFSDAILIAGIRSSPNVLPNFDVLRACLRGNKAGTTMVGVGEVLIKIANSTATLNGVLQDLITEIKNLVTATAAITVTPGSLAGPSSPPLNAAAITTITTNLTATATKIAGLLE